MFIKIPTLSTCFWLKLARRLYCSLIYNLSHWHNFSKLQVTINVVVNVVVNECELNKIFAHIKCSKHVAVARKYSLVHEPRVYIRCFARLLL